MCRPLLQWLNGAFHARQSVRHLNETDYAAMVWPGFSLAEVAATGEPYRGREQPPRRRGQRRGQR